MAMGVHARRGARSGTGTGGAVDVDVIVYAHVRAGTCRGALSTQESPRALLDPCLKKRESSCLDARL